MTPDDEKVTCDNGKATFYTFMGAALGTVCTLVVGGIIKFGNWYYKSKRRHSGEAQAFEMEKQVDNAIVNKKEPDVEDKLIIKDEESVSEKNKQCDSVQEKHSECFQVL